MAPTTFVVSPNASWHGALVLLTSNLRPIVFRQPWSLLTSDMSIQPCQVNGYGLTCHYVISVSSISLFLTLWRSLGLTKFEVELSLDFWSVRKLMGGLVSDVVWSGTDATRNDVRLLFLLATCSVTEMPSVSCLWVLVGPRWPLRQR
ncbi:hypothetical protein AMTR_s00014p00251460 [Amborella trichopoda]|uniref:Uncharacterized protein n=1 Tax=Amborella trichopoda TaxID=13333 RepID=W1PNC8_AMBTC|nr:hypothetical protein AMTR_s00014p00251460 [Amborella trichopoda]